jgi:hypothetical protein
MKFWTTVTALCSYVILLMLPFDSAAQQPWMKAATDKKNPNFFEVRQSFNSYWKIKAPDGKIPKAKGYKQFKRWEWFWEPRVGKTGNFPSESIVMQEREKYRSAIRSGKKQSGLGNPFSNNQLKEKDAGATSMASPPPPSTSGGWTALGPSSSNGGYAGVGRLNSIAFHPTNATTFWVGSPAGGLWKTTTGGASWTTLTDNLPVMGVSAIVIDPSNTSTMYIATGDRDAGDTYSVGVLKSTNGGSSWSATGLSYTVSQNIKVKGLIINPSNSLILLAATSNGIYRTTNGGTSWTLEESGDFQEILFKPGDPATVYASSIGSAQIFKSVNGGDTWSQVTSFSGIYRIALAVTPANPAVVGALCSNNYDYGFGGYYTSTNSGASFGLKYAATSVNLLGWDAAGGDAGGQGWYDLCLSISPTNANVIYAGGVNTWKSSNGGANWAISTMWYGGTGVPEVHADKHYMAFSPVSTGTLYQCNDGGLYKTSDGGATWTDLTNGLQITQFYRMGNAATNANRTIAGAQDNGTKLRNTATYTDVIGGDGMEAIIDYTNANIMYGSLYYGQIQKSTDGGVNWTGISGSLPSGAWVTPYVIDPVDPQVLYAGVGGNVWKTTNRGSSWSAISSSLSVYELQSLAVAPSNTQVIYAGSYYNLYKSTNGGGSWSTVTLPAYDAVTSIEIHPTNPLIVWITFSGYSAGSKVFKTEDGGATWTNISGTLPNLPTNTIEYDKNTGVLYLGNDLGVFVRHPDMQDWQLFDTGLPNVIVTELEIQYSSGRLRAATYGRGLWESDLFTGTVTPSYCAPVYTNGCTGDDYIHNFSFNTLVNNNSGCSNGTTNGYTVYDPAGALTTTVSRGQSYSLKMQSGSSWAQGFGVWIDYNNDKDFDDAGEFVYASPSASTSLYTTTLTIPGSAIAGATRLRVRCKYNDVVTSAEPCSSFSWGEAEDYTITIANASPTITTFLPTSGPAGIGVYIKGTNLNDVSAVRFNGVAATQIYKATATMLYATVPSGATTGKIQVVAGGNTVTSSATFTVAAITTKWTAKATLAAARLQHGTIGTGGKIYVFGGRNSSALLSSLEIYNPATNSWSLGAPMPVAIRGMAFALGSNGSIYMFGGANSSATVTSTYRYTPSTNTWTALASMPVAVFEAAAAATSNGKIYVFGGEPSSDKTTSTNATRIYDIATNSWSTGANMPTGVQQHSAITGADGKIYVFGGRAFSAEAPVGLVQIYNPATNAWSSGSAMPIPKVQFGAIRAGDGRIYIVGGKAEEPNSTGPFFHAVEIYNPVANTWATGPVLPGATGQQAAVKLSDNLYAIGGSDNTVRNYNLQLVLAPVAPASLTATAVSSSQINLKWSDKSLNESGFIIEQATTASGPFSPIASVGSNTTSYSNTGLAAGTKYYYRVKATNSEGSSAYSNVVSATTSGSGPTTLRINSGGGSVSTTLGTFSADAYHTGSTSVSTTTAGIDLTTDDALYQDYRKAAANGGTFGYHIPVANGTYTVKLFFVEAFWTATGKRKFNVTAEGAAWLSNYDVFAAAGGIRRAKTESRSVTVSDGYLDLSFTSLVDKALVCAIEIVPVTSTVITQAAPKSTQEVAEQGVSGAMLYPNPVHSTLWVTLHKPYEKARVTVTNAVGATMLNRMVNGNTSTFEMNVSALRPGIYNLNLQTANGFQTFRFVKE